MSDEHMQAELKQQITADFILDLYEQAQQLPEGDERRVQMAMVDVLSKHVGDWLVLDD